MSNLEEAIKALQNNTNTSIQNPPFTINQKYIWGGPIAENLRKMIREERKKQGLSQRALALKAGISQGTITRAETRLWVSLGGLLKIITALDKTITLT